MNPPLLLIPIAVEWVILITTLAPIFLPTRKLFLRVPTLGLGIWFASFLSAGIATATALIVSIWSVVATWLTLEANPALSPNWLLAFGISFAPWLMLALGGISLALINLRIEPLIHFARKTHPQFQSALRPVQNFMGKEVFELPLSLPVAFTRRGQIIVSTAVRDSLPDDEFQAVLWHELAHIALKHNSLKSLAGFVQSISPGLAASKALVIQVDALCEIAADKRALRNVDPETLHRARSIFLAS